MDKRTLLAVVLSVVVITVGFIIQSTFFMPPPEELEQQAQSAQSTQNGAVAQDQAQTGSGGATDTDTDTGQAQAQDQAEQETEGFNQEAGEAQTVATDASGIVPYGDDPVRQPVNLENELFDITFDSRGAKATSIKLKKHLDQGEPLEMVIRENEQQGAFQIHFGKPYDPAVDENFHVRRIDGNTVEFYRDFAVRNSSGELVPFLLKKRFVFKPQD